MASASALLGAAQAVDINTTQITNAQQSAGGSTQSTGGAASQGIAGTLTGGSTLTVNQQSPQALAALTAAVGTAFSAITAVSAGSNQLASQVANKALDTAQQTLEPASAQGAAFAQKLIWPVVILVSILACIGLWFFFFIGGRRKKEKEPKAPKKKATPAPAPAAEGGS